MTLITRITAHRCAGEASFRSERLRMGERPWWMQLGGQPAWASSPRWWDKSTLARVGFISSIIWGGGLILRLIFPDKLGGDAWFYAVLTLASLVALLVGVAQAHRPRSEE